MELLSLEAALVLVHVLCATVWAGGHLVLALRILPAALATRDAEALQTFEKRYEPLAAPSLVLLLVTGLFLSGTGRPSGSGWVGFGDGWSTLVTVKLLLVGATLALALHAKLRLGELREETLSTYAWHARAVTVLAVLLVVAGVGLRVL